MPMAIHILSVMFVLYIVFHGLSGLLYIPIEPIVTLYLLLHPHKPFYVAAELVASSAGVSTSTALTACIAIAWFAICVIWYIFKAVVDGRTRRSVRRSSRHI